MGNFCRILVTVGKLLCYFFVLHLMSFEALFRRQVESSQNISTGVIEYCERQTFKAACPDGEVVLMQSSHYGRMRHGRCLTVTNVNAGCDIDVLDQFDLWCSGQRSCEVKVSSIIDSLPEHEFPCMKDFRGYLEASYTCVSVINRRKEDCAQPSSVDITAATSTGYLASIVTEESGCGSLDTPWLLRALPGQTIRLRMYDFAIASRDRTQPGSIPRVCHVYAVVKERTIRASDTVCGGDQREVNMYTSTTNQIEVRMVAASSPTSQAAIQKKAQRNTYFMFMYSAVGCPDLVPSAGEGIDRLGDITYITCNGTTEKQQLKCENNKWTGERKNCSPSFWKSQETSEAGWGSVWVIFTGSQWVAITVILAIALTIGLIIFICGLIYLKRRRTNRRYIGCGNPHCVPEYHLSQCPAADHALLQSATSSKTFSAPSTATVDANTENDYFRTWQLQRHAVCGGSRTGNPVQTSFRPYPGAVLQLSPEQPGGGGGQGCRAFVEHIYESPKFDRKECFPAVGESGEYAGESCSDPGLAGLQQQQQLASSSRRGMSLQSCELDPHGNVRT